MRELQNIPAERKRFQQRLAEEIARSERFDRPFALAIFEAAPSSIGMPLLERMARGLNIVRASLRVYDVLAPVFEDTVAALMLETTGDGAHAGLLRVRNRLANHAGAWTIRIYAYPAQATEIQAVEAVRAA